MRLSVMLGLLQVVLGLGVAYHWGTAPGAEPTANTSLPTAEVDAAPAADPRSGCVGSRPCCELAEDGSGRCAIFAVCFAFACACACP